MGSIGQFVLNHFLSVTSWFARLLFHIFVYLFIVGKKRVVPAPKNPILYKSATRIATEIREGKRRIRRISIFFQSRRRCLMQTLVDDLRLLIDLLHTLREQKYVLSEFRLLCEDVVKSFIERIREVQPYVNAVAEERYDEAIKEAAKVDELVASKVKTPEEIANETPLLGVPVTVKILITVKGLECNGGSTRYRGFKAHDDAALVSRLKKAGAIILATTNSPEFGLHIETFNHVYGTTRNPYDTRRTPGGSSGGESALISSAGSVLGIGNDMIASIREPAFFTGIFGHKPTKGLVSNKGIFPNVNEEVLSCVCNGPLCRYAEDLVLSMKVLADPMFPMPLKLDSPVDFSKVKIRYVENDGGNPVVPSTEPDILETLHKVLSYFKSVYGSDVCKAEVKTMKSALHTCFSYTFSGLKKPLKETLYGEESGISPKMELLKLLLGRSKLSATVVLAMNTENSFLFMSREKAEEKKKRLEEEFDQLLGENCVLLTPVFPKKAVYHYECCLLAIATNVTSCCNVAGLPATQCPTGMSEDGRPLGVQVIGGRGQDHLTIAFAKEIEKVFGGWIPPSTEPKKAVTEA